MTLHDHPSSKAHLFPRFRWTWGLLALALLLGVAACSAEPEGPISALHHFRKGNEAFLIEDYARAIRHYTEAIELDENSAEIRYNLGLAYLKSDNLADAVEAFNAAVAIDPTMADAHYNLALAYDRLYDPEAAHAHFNTYRRLIAGAAKPKDEKEAAAAKQGQPGGTTGKAPANGQRAKAVPPGHGPGQAGRPPARAAAQTTAPPNGPPTGRQPTVAQGRAPASQGASGSTQGGSQKWWTQDRFNQKP